MPVNFLEELVSEWYEFTGYFVRRNVLVGPRPAGGYECELDVVAFNPETKHLVHVEPSMDADSWERREERYQRKFAAGKKYIPQLFKGLALTQDTPIEQIALLVFASKANRATLAGGQIMLLPEFLVRVLAHLDGKSLARNAISEHHQILRTLQAVNECRDAILRVWTKEEARTPDPVTV